MRPNLITVSALFLATMSPFAVAQAPASVTRAWPPKTLSSTTPGRPASNESILATAVGVYRYNDLLGDYSLAASAARHQRELADLASIKAIDPTGFPEQDLISHDLFLANSRARRGLRPQRIRDAPQRNGGGGGIHANLADLPLSMPFDS